MEDVVSGCAPPTFQSELLSFVIFFVTFSFPKRGGEVGVGGRSRRRSRLPTT